MDTLLESIKAAIAVDATSEQKTAGVAACRTILAALESEPGKPIAMPGAPAPHPLAGIDISQALDLLIGKLRASLAEKTAPPTKSSGVRFAYVNPRKR